MTTAPATLAEWPALLVPAAADSFNSDSPFAKANAAFFERKRMLVQTCC
jgi:hypothetical protein